MLDAIGNILFRLLALILLILLTPLFLLMFLLIKLTSKGPFIFKQKRMGKDKKIFIMYKIRTMVQNAEDLRSKIKDLNEADGPVFKIRHDPRYTKIGKILSHAGLDELPQFINIIKGEMTFVGPRPLPVIEALKMPKKYSSRFSVLPGLTSLWAIKGGHKLSFKEWMELDSRYIKDKNLFYDILVILSTIVLISKLIVFKLLLQTHEKIQDQ